MEPRRVLKYDFNVFVPEHFLFMTLYSSSQAHLRGKYILLHYISQLQLLVIFLDKDFTFKKKSTLFKIKSVFWLVTDHETFKQFFFLYIYILALRRLRGCDVQSCELDEILQEQAETKGMRPSRPWELFADRSVRWQLITVMIISSAMQLCGNDSVRRAGINVPIREISTVCFVSLQKISLYNP